MANDTFTWKQHKAGDHVVHQTTMAWENVSKLVAKQVGDDKISMSKLMLENLIPPAARSGEDRGMKWPDFYLITILYFRRGPVF